MGETGEDQTGESQTGESQTGEPEVGSYSLFYIIMHVEKQATLDSLTDSLTGWLKSKANALGGGSAL